MKMTSTLICSQTSDATRGALHLTSIEPKFKVDPYHNNRGLVGIPRLITVLDSAPK
jgi:hypothetical protein